MDTVVAKFTKPLFLGIPGLDEKNKNLDKLVKLAFEYPIQWEFTLSSSTSFINQPSVSVVEAQRIIQRMHSLANTLADEAYAAGGIGVSEGFMKFAACLHGDEVAYLCNEGFTGLELLLASNYDRVQVVTGNPEAISFELVKKIQKWAISYELNVAIYADRFYPMYAQDINLEMNWAIKNLECENSIHFENLLYDVYYRRNGRHMYAPFTRILTCGNDSSENGMFIDPALVLDSRGDVCPDMCREVCEAIYND